MISADPRYQRKFATVNGKRMAYTRVEMRAKGEKKVAVTATSAFAYLED